MSLFSTRVTEWTTKKPGNRLRVAINDTFMLNTNRIIEMVATSDLTSAFWYANDPDDARDSPDHIACNCDVYAIRQYHDRVETDKFGTFSIFPGWDRTETPVDTEIEWTNICYVYQTPTDYSESTSHMVYYRKAWERVECLIDMTPTDVNVEAGFEAV